MPRSGLPGYTAPPWSAGLPSPPLCPSSLSPPYHSHPRYGFRFIVPDTYCFPRRRFLTASIVLPPVLRSFQRPAPVRSSAAVDSIPTEALAPSAPVAEHTTSPLIRRNQPVSRPRQGHPTHFDGRALVIPVLALLRLKAIELFADHAVHDVGGAVDRIPVAWWILPGVDVCIALTVQCCPPKHIDTNKTTVWMSLSHERRGTEGEEHRSNRLNP